MNSWIRIDFDGNPPDDLSVLLLIVEYHDKENTSVWDSYIVAGFYSEEIGEESNFHIEKIPGEFEYRPIKQTDNIKIVAWTLLPELPDNDKLTNKKDL